MSLIASISEVLAFYLAASIIKCLGVNLSSITIFLAFALRFLGYYFIRRPYFLLFVESMHFFNFGILYVLIAQKADSIGLCFFEILFEILFEKQNQTKIFSSSSARFLRDTTRHCLRRFIWPRSRYRSNCVIIHLHSSTISIIISYICII